MITRQELEGQWSELKGQIQQRWGSLTDNELQQARGSANELIGLIQQKTGETRRTVEDFLEEAVSGGGTMVKQAVDTAKEYADQAKQAARKGYDQVSESVNDGLAQAQDMVRRNPMESVAVSFGAGLIAGVVVGLVLKSR